MNTAKLFLNGRSQAVRLPKEFRFDEDEILITKIDDMVILFPRSKGWELLAKGIERFTSDFMSERDEPSAADERRPL